MSDTPEKPAGEEQEEEKAVTVKVLKEMIPDLMANYDEALERRSKAFDLSQSKKDEEKLDGVKKFAETVKFLNAFANDDRKVLGEMHAANPNFVNFKTMNEASGSAGGYLVPIEFETSIVKYMEQYSQIRDLSTVLPMNSSTKRLNSLVGEPTAYIVGESVGITGSALTLGEPIFTAKKYAALVDWTSEVDEDAELPLVTLVAQRIARAISKKEQVEFITGATAGSEGLLAVTGVTNVNLRKDATFTGTTFSDVTWDDLSNMSAALEEIDLVDAEQAVYLMSPSVWNVLKKQKASGSGEYLVYSNPQNKVVGQAWGKDIVLCNQMPKTSATATGTKFVILSNFKMHSFIGDRRGITMKVSTEGTVAGNNLFERDEAALRTTKRTAFVTALQDGIVTLSTN